jgi:hypothetical protein
LRHVLWFGAVNLYGPHGSLPEVPFLQVSGDGSSNVLTAVLPHHAKFPVIAIQQSAIAFLLSPPSPDQGIPARDGDKFVDILPSPVQPDAKQRVNLFPIDLR